MKKLLSLFTILCCIFTFASFPALAVETSNEVVSFYDNFDTETDTTPDNWQLYSDESLATVTVEEENGNKFLRLKATEGVVNNGANVQKQPLAITKPNVVNFKLSETEKLVIKAKLRHNETGSGNMSSLRLGYPHADVDFTDSISASYAIFGFRENTVRFLDFDGSHTQSWLDTLSGYTTSVNKWYDTTTVIDAKTKTYTLTITDGTNTATTTGNMTRSGATSFFNEVDLIKSLAIKITGATSVSTYMDIDDVYVCYIEDYADYLPKVLSFEDTFENATVDSAPTNWIDKRGVSTIKVMEETGNKFVRVTKNAGTTGAPYVVSKDGVINLPWKEIGKGFVVEAKMRLHTTTGSVAYRHYLMLNSPYIATDSELESFYNTPFFFHKNLQAYSKPGGASLNTFTQNNEWFQYRAVIVPKGTQTEINHYFNDKFIKSDYISSSSMPVLFNSDALYNIAFPWRLESGASSTATADGYMDFDDVKVYEMTDFIHKITVTDANGAKIDKLVNGTVNVNANVINNGKTRQVDVIAALYTKDGDNWKLTGTKNVVNSDNNSYVYSYAWRHGLANLSLNVTDAENQMLKVFVWNRAIDNDSNPADAETLTLMNPVCAPIVITK